MAELRRPDATLRYVQEGTGRPPVVLTHGFSSTSHVFVPRMPPIAATHRAIAWDLRGHGASAADDPAGYTAEASIGDLEALIELGGDGPAVLVGHSLGGYLSLRLAVTRPDLVAGLLLVDTGPGFRAAAGRDRWNAFAGRSAADIEARGLAALSGGAEVDPSAHHSAAALALAGRGILSQHDALVVDGLAAIAVPVAVVVGADDANFLAGSEHMATKIPDATLTVVDGAGHSPHVTHPEVFDREAAALLARVGGAAA